MFRRLSEICGSAGSLVVLMIDGADSASDTGGNGSYLFSFHFNKKEVGVKVIRVKDGTIVEAVV